MKKILIGLLLIVSTITSWAYDFSAVAPSGQTLYYYISGGNAVVTFPGTPGYYYEYYSYNYGRYDFPKPQGTLVIPSTVSNNGTTYTVVGVGNHAFDRCSGLTNVTIPNTVTTIGEYAFLYCSGIVNVSMSNSTTIIGQEAFNGCSGLTELSIPSSVNTIEKSAFEYCSSIIRLVIPDSVCTIGQEAFSGCNALRSIRIGKSVNSIGVNAFSFCTILDTLFYNARSLSNGRGLRSISNLRILVLGDDVQSIPNATFYGQSNLDSIEWGNSLLTIGDSVFCGCVGMQKITIPNTVSSIGDRAFSGCTSLISLSLGSSVSIIGSYAFENCTGLTSMTIPSSVTSIGDGAFSGCSNVDTLYYNARELSTGPSWYTPNHHPSYSYRTFDSYGFRPLTNLQVLIIGDSVMTIPDGAFYNQRSLSNIVIPSSVIRIGSHAFYGCIGNAGSFVLPAGLQSIGDSAFCGWSYLVDVSMGDSVTSIGMGAFAGCYRLSSVTFGNGLENIGDKAFAGCTRLTSPVLPEGLLQIGSRAFDGCTYIEGELRFPSSVTSVGAYAYSGCGNITQLIMKGATPPTISNLTFDGIATTTPVRVPCGAGMNYYLSDNWENFSNIAESPQREIRVSSTNPTMGEATLTQEPTCTNATAIITATAYAGFHFLRWTDGVTSNPRQFTATSDTAFEAMFVANNSYITVHSNDSTMGSVSGSGLYGWNAPVVLQATANSNYHFLRWSDGNTQNPRYLMATQDSVFTAIFVSNISNIQVGSMNPDMGYAIGGGLSYYQNQVSLTAIPNYGYHFVSWSDGNTSNPRTVTVVQDTLFWAVFAVNNYAIHVTSNNSSFGSVSGTGSYLFNTEMSMSASPAYGYHFVQWNDGNIQNPRTITVTRDSMFTAQFAANIYQISTDANDPTMGTAYGAGIYSYNMQISLSATAEYGYHFVQWSDGSTDNPRLVTVTNNASFTALFAINNYTLTVTSSNPAIGTTQGGGNYNYLTPVNISANANTGYHFTQWNDGNTDNPRLVTVTQNATYTAQFAINIYAISATSNNSVRGMVSGSGTYAHFSQDTLEATAFYGYHFAQWSDGNTENPRVIVVAEAATFVAQFEPNMYQVLGTSSDATIGVVSGSGTYAYQSQAPLTAIASDHHHFVRWTDGLTDNPRMVTVVRDTILTAEFAIDQYQLLVHSSDSTRGSVEGGGMYAYMTSVTMTASPMVHNHFVRWSDGNTSNPRIMTMVADVELTALFEEDDKYVVNVMANDSTYGTVSGGGEYYAGAQITIRATAQNHYYFSEWSDGSSENPRVVTVIGNMTYTANFEPNPYVVTVAANDLSRGNVSGAGTYPYGSEVEIFATAYPGFVFVKWHDGDSNATRNITVLDNCYYQAIFEADNTEGISDIEYDYSVRTANMQIVVDGVMGRKVEVYDISGRRIAYIDKNGDKMIANVPARGVYLIKVGDTPARKVVVM